MNQAPRNRLAFSTRTIHGGQGHDPRPARSWCRSMRPRPTASRALACTRASNMRAARTRRALPSSAPWPTSKAGPPVSRSPRAWRPSHGVRIARFRRAIVATDDIYGGTFRLLERVRKRSAGLQVSFVDFTDLAAVEAAIRPETRMLWVETPTNPLLRIVDSKVSPRWPGATA